MDQAMLGMPSREYYLTETDSEYKAAYLRYMISVCPSVCLSVCLSHATRRYLRYMINVRPSVHLSVCPSVCLSRA